MNRLNQITRITKTEDIGVPEGYKIKAFLEGLTIPINLTFTDQWEMLMADAGITTGSENMYPFLDDYALKCLKRPSVME